jgi:hypothetical protein
MLSPVIEPGIDAVVVDPDLKYPSPLKREQAFALQCEKTLPRLTDLVAVYAGVEGSQWGRSSLARHFDAKVPW